MKKRSKLSGLISALMILTLLLSACGNSSSSSQSGGGSQDSSQGGGDVSSEASGDPYVIGVSVPLTGSAAVGGNYQLWASEYAADEINAAGGINGRMIEIKALDDAEDVTQAAIVAQQFCDDESVVAVIAHSASTLTAITQPIFEEAGLCNISSCSSNSKLSTYGYEYWLRNIVSNDTLVPYTVAFAKNNLGLTKGAMVVSTTDNGATMATAVNETAPKLGVEILVSETYNAGTESDFSSIITKIMNSDAEVLFYQANYSDGGAFLRQMHDLGLDIPVVSLSWLTYTSTIELAGVEAAQNLYCTVCPSPFGGTESKQAFLDAFREEYGQDIIPTTPALLNYDCVYIIAQALEEGATKENLAQWIKNYPGLHDDYTFTLKGLNMCDEYSIDENGDVAQWQVDVIAVDEQGEFYDYGIVDETGLYE